MRVIAFDTETERIGPGNLAPKIICASFAVRDANNGGEIASWLVGNGPDEDLEQQLRAMLTDEGQIIVTHNGGFDYACVMNSYPDLIPLVFDAIEAGRCTDTLWREKLLNLSTTGKLEKMRMPDGSKADIRYGLSDLEMSYFGRDRSEDKDDTEESWRANYSVLDGWHSSEYPEDARKYALEDGEGTLLVYEAQEERKEQWSMAQTVTEEFQLASSFALYLMSCWGMATDPVAVDAMSVEVQKRLDAVVGGLVKVGFLRAPVPSQPYISQQKKALKILGLSEAPADWSPYRDTLLANRIKFTEAKDPSKDTKRIQAYVAALFKKLGKIPAMTAGGSREPQIQLDAEVQEMLAVHDPVMADFQKREALAKLVGQQLPLLRGNAIVYPKYDALKETGRTSSYGNKKGTTGLYPAVHIQGVPNEIDGIDPRQCYVPRPRRTLFDNDYTALELACVGQITYELFGESVHLTRYNQGVDLHGYLGAQLVVMGATDGLGYDFSQGCRTEGIISDPMAVYEAFMLCKKHEDEDVRKFWKESRNFAKPVGLGFPGGLGPETMVEFARKTYGVHLTEEQASDFRDMWREVYPEMPRFFDWVNSQGDDYNDGELNPETGRVEKLYHYFTPLGMVRRGASFCATANGKCMQSPGAEGAKIAMIRLQRLCYDPTQGSILFGCRPIAFVHDQVIGETTEDRSLWHDQCMEVRRVMCESMQVVLPDIKMRSDEAHLTSVWSKKSVPTFGSDGRLIPWSPVKAA